MPLQLEIMLTSTPADNNISSQTDDFIDNLHLDSFTLLYICTHTYFRKFLGSKWEFSLIVIL